MILRPKQSRLVEDFKTVLKIEIRALKGAFVRCLDHFYEKCIKFKRALNKIQ